MCRIVFERIWKCCIFSHLLCDRIGACVPHPTLTVPSTTSLSPCYLPQMDVFDAAQRYKEDGRQVIVLAGKEYGSGSSRDWAAKGPFMLVGRFTGYSAASCYTMLNIPQLWLHISGITYQTNGISLLEYCHINGLVQHCGISIANALKTLQSCTKPSTCDPLKSGCDSQDSLWLQGLGFLPV